MLVLSLGLDGVEGYVGKSASRGLLPKETVPGRRLRRRAWGVAVLMCDGDINHLR